MTRLSQIRRFWTFGRTGWILSRAPGTADLDNGRANLAKALQYACQRHPNPERKEQRIPGTARMLRVAGRSTSINVRKVVWTLRELGEPFELVDPSVDPLAAHSLVSLNPLALAPVLQDGDRVLWESNTICRYLTARSDRKDLLPDHPADRSEVEKWMDWQATNLNSAWVASFMALVRGDPAFAGNADAIARSAERWNALSLVLEAHLANAEYLALGRFTLADIVIGLSVHRWLGTPMSKPATPHLQRYYAELCRSTELRSALGAGAP